MKRSLYQELVISCNGCLQHILIAYLCLLRIAQSIVSGLCLVDGYLAVNRYFTDGCNLLLDRLYNSNQLIVGSSCRIQHILVAYQLLLIFGQSIVGSFGVFDGCLAVNRYFTDCHNLVFYCSYGCKICLTGSRQYNFRKLCKVTEHLNCCKVRSLTIFIGENSVHTVWRSPSR